MDIDHTSLLNDYYFRIEQNFLDLIHNLNDAIRWQYVLQCRDLNNENNDYYESKAFRSFKRNFFVGTIKYEEDLIDPIFVSNQYMKRRLFIS